MLCATEEIPGDHHHSALKTRDWGQDGLWGLRFRAVDNFFGLGVLVVVPGMQCAIFVVYIQCTSIHIRKGSCSIFMHLLDWFQACLQQKAVKL